MKQNKASLKKYGILTPDEKAEEDAIKERKQQERLKQQEESRQRKAKQECQSWWDGAVCLYGPINVDDEQSNNKDNHDFTPQDDLSWKERHLKIIERYSSDYNRWSDYMFKPNDPATIEEKEVIEARLEEKQCEEFERANRDFCDSFMTDFEKRNQAMQNKKQSANTIRVKGNRLFRSKDYNEALAKYQHALALDPFDYRVLLNIALCHTKLEAWDDALEFFNRTLHIDKSSIKALYNRSLVYSEMKKHNEALSDLDKCRSLEPTNSDVLLKYEMVSRNIFVYSAETTIEQIMNGIDSAKPMNEMSARLAFIELSHDKENGNELNLYKNLLLFKLMDYLLSQIMIEGKFLSVDHDGFCSSSSLIFLIKSYTITHIYLRKSGKLDLIISVAHNALKHRRVSNICNSPTVSDQDNTEMSLLVLAECIRVDTDAKTNALSVCFMITYIGI